MQKEVSMVYVITILIFIIAFVIDKVRKNSINNQVKNDKNKKEYIIKSVLEDRICKYNNKIVFVISDKKLLHLDWLQNGDLYHSVFKFDLDSAFIKNGFNYNFIEIEKSIDKDNIELIKINNVKSLLIELYDVIIPDINELHASINTTKKNINIAESLVNKTQYIELMKKYLLTQETILQKALDMQNRYNYNAPICLDSTCPKIRWTSPLMQLLYVPFLGTCSHRSRLESRTPEIDGIAHHCKTSYSEQAHLSGQSLSGNL